MPYASILNFIGETLSLGVSSIVMALLLNRSQIRSFSKFFISWFVLFCSHIIVLEVILGVFNILTYANVSTGAYVLGFGALIVFFTHVQKKMVVSAKPEYPSIILTLLLFAPIVFLLFVKTMNAALQIPLEYDSMVYHLPFVVEWFTTQGVNNLYYSAFSGPLSYYPSTYELFDLWTVLPFGNDYFVNLLTFPLFIVLGVVLWRILRNVGVEKNIALVATTLPFYMPIFLHQAGLPLVDLFFTVTFLIAIYFLQEITLEKENKTPANFLLFGLAFGLFIGTKYLGLMYGAPIIVFSAGILFYNAMHKRKSNNKMILAVLFGILLTGSFFYIRNWLNTGNPIYPVDLSIVGLRIFEGVKGANGALTSTALSQTLFEFGKMKEFVKTFFYLTGPFGVISIGMPLVLLALSIVSFIRNRRTTLIANKTALTSLLLAIATAVFFYLYIRAPYTGQDLPQNIRYAMPFLVMGTVCIGYFVQVLTQTFRWIPRVFFYGAAFLVCTFSFVHLVVNPSATIAYSDKVMIDYRILWTYKIQSLELAAAILSFFAGVYLIISKKIAKKTHLIATTMLFIISLSLSVNFVHFTATEREILTPHWLTFWFKDDQNTFDYFGVAEWFNTNAPHAKIAYTGFNFHYPLYGRQLAREVDYVNINECSECRYSDYRYAEKSLRRDPNYENWMLNLRKKQKEYLVVNPVRITGVESYEFKWALEHRTRFTEVFTVHNMHVFSIAHD